MAERHAAKIRKDPYSRALDDAAARINDDPAMGGIKIVVDADTEGVVGTPHVTETILDKIRSADIFAPDLTFVATTTGAKLVPNPNVMIEYGYALKALGFTTMMPVMNTFFGPPESLPFDMGHVRHPLQFNIDPATSDGPRRAARDGLAQKIEDVLRVMVASRTSAARKSTPFVPAAALRAPAFFFQPDDVLANFGEPGEQEMRFKRSRAFFARLYPTYGDQPRVGNAGVRAAIHKVKPMAETLSGLSVGNDYGAINLDPHGDGISSFTQVFSTGEMWAATERPFRSGNPSGIAGIGVEKAYLAAIENYLLVYEKDFKFIPPFTLELGATGLKDSPLFLPSLSIRGVADTYGPIRIDSFSHTYQLESYDRAEWLGVLREFFIELYDLAGVSRADVLLEESVAANGLPAL